MLESNTDRSYFMIGAVIVAAVLIAGALYIFRDQLFSTEKITVGNEQVAKGYVPRLVDNLFGDANTMVNNIDTKLGPGGKSGN